ncbi:MAG TPA: phosphatase PAP2 family protein, partial [Jatrophihabitans sp.]|nr:phosphatase PAP2 family protein [Jatrophihabitans sp.]
SRLWLGYPLVTASVVVATGNHYVLDVLAGICIALISLALAYRYPRSRQYGRAGASRVLRPVRLAMARLLVLAAHRSGLLAGGREPSAADVGPAEADGDEPCAIGKSAWSAGGIGR